MTTYEAVSLSEAELRVLTYSLDNYDRSLTHALARYELSNTRRNNLANRRERARVLRQRLAACRDELLADSLVSE
jgi:hypothetical protein